MKTKILLGSIGASVILILVSFTNVVGIQSIPIDSVNISPLFEYRTKKAINETHTPYHYQYIGMKNRWNISLAAPDQKRRLVLTFIESIIQMDETTFNTLIAYCINNLNKNNKMDHANIAEIITGLKNIRKNPEYIINQIANKSYAMNNNYDIQQYTIDASWIPGCLLVFIIDVIFFIFVVYPIAIIFLFITAMKGCLNSIGTEVNCCPCYRVQLNRYLYDLDLNFPNPVNPPLHIR